MSQPGVISRTRVVSYHRKAIVEESTVETYETRVVAATARVCDVTLERMRVGETSVERIARDVACFFVRANLVRSPAMPWGDVADLLGYDSPRSAQEGYSAAHALRMGSDLFPRVAAAAFPVIDRLVLPPLFRPATSRVAPLLPE